MNVCKNSDYGRNGYKMDTLCETCREELSNFDFNSLLYMAVNKRHLRCVNMLIKAGADVNGNNNYQGNTVLIYTGVRIDEQEDPLLVECVSLLLAAGADVNLLNCNKYSALMYFSREGCMKCVRLLIEAGAYVNIRNKNGESALSLAALADRFRCMQVLIEAGADVNNKDARCGETVLHQACGDRDCLRLSLQSEARINRHNIQSRNALTSYLTWPYGVTKENVMLLAAAGETIDGTVCTRGTDDPVDLSKYLSFRESGSSLKSMCRSVIRNHLMTLDPHGNLFSRVPYLGLSSSLNDYLLYDVTLHDHLLMQ